MVVKWYPHYNEVRIRDSPCYQPPTQEKMSLDQTLRSYAWLYELLAKDENYQRMWSEVRGVSSLDCKQKNPYFIRSN